MDPADVLEQAADAIDTIGWHRGSYVRFSPEGDEVIGYCALGACRKAAGLVVADRDVLDNFNATNFIVFSDAVAALAVHIRFPSVVSWNDCALTSRDDVVEALRATAKDLRNEVTV